MGEFPGSGELERIFSELVREFSPPLYAFARRITHDDHVAEDIVQDVFLRLWQARTAWPATANMESWLYRVTENRVIDFLRKKATEQKYRRSLLHKEQDYQTDPGNQIENREMRDMLSRTVQQLPGQRQAIYRLHKEESLSYREIAEDLQLSPHTVKNQLFSAIRYLRSRLRGLRP